MRCPKCHYLGYSSGDRCRHCGYDFSLAPASRATEPELPLRSPADAGPLADLAIARPDPNPTADAVLQEEIDSPRQPGAAEADLPLRHDSRPTASDRVVPAAPEAPVRPAAPPVPTADRARSASSGPSARRPAPQEAPRLFDPRDGEARREPRATPRAPVGPASPVTAPLAASPGVRFSAAAVDLGIFAGLAAIILTLTLRVTGLGLDQWDRIPLLPFAGFLLLLAAGYATGFTAASGQTIGKMALGVRVVGLDGRIVPIPTALRRFGGQLASLFALGLGFVPVITDSDRRAFHDRLAGTRVVDA